MASTWGETITIPGLVAGADLSQKQYHVVKMNSTAGEVVAVTASTDAFLGILHDAPADGAAATVIGLGVAVAIAGTSDLAAGERVGFNSTGQVEDAHALKVGIALDDSTAIGDEVRVLLTGL